MVKPPSPDTDDTSTISERTAPTGTPGWVKAFGIIGLVPVLLFGVLQLVGGGNHGPSRHSPSSDLGDTPPTSITKIHSPPEGGH